MLNDGDFVDVILLYILFKVVRTQAWGAHEEVIGCVILRNYTARAGKRITDIGLRPANSETGLFIMATHGAKPSLNAWQFLI